MKRFRVSGYAKNNPVYAIGKNKSDAIKKWNKKYCRKGKRCFLRITTSDLLD